MLFSKKVFKAFAVGFAEGLLDSALTGQPSRDKKQLDDLSNGQDTVFIDGKEYTRYEAEIKQSKGELYNPSYW